MTLEINSKILGKALTFSRPGKGYIFVDLNGKEGSETPPCVRGRPRYYFVLGEPAGNTPVCTGKTAFVNQFSVH